MTARPWIGERAVIDRSYSCGRLQFVVFSLNHS